MGTDGASDRAPARSAPSLRLALLDTAVLAACIAAAAGLSLALGHRKTRMEETIARRIREHKGPLYSLSYPAGSGVDALLARRIFKVTETCLPVVTKMRTSPIELCRVVQAR